MNYTFLGPSGLRVSQLSLGTMTFGTEWGWGSDAAGSRAVYDAYRAAGGNFIDTANYYTGGSSERILGDIIQGEEREQVVLATKYTLGMRQGDPNSGGNHRKNLVQAVEASLKRLQTDYIDLLWLHAWDFTTSVREVMLALDSLSRSGKVLHIAVSDTPAWIVAQANTLADAHGWHKFIALQIEYSLIQRTPERDLLPMARAFGLSVTPWSPLGGGLLTGKHKPGKAAEGARLKETSARFNDRNFAIVSAVEAVAAELGVPPAQVALAWLRHVEPTFVPILGARTLEQLQDNLASLNVALDAGQLARLDEVSRVDGGFPHEFLHSDNVRNIIFQGTHAQVDWPSRDRL